MLLGVTNSAFAPRIRAAQDVEERMLKWVEEWSRASSVGTLQPYTIVEIVINDDVLYQASDLMIAARPDSGVDMPQVPTGPVPKPHDEGKDEGTNKENQGGDDPMEGRGDKVSQIDLGALERDL